MRRAIPICLSLAAVLASPLAVHAQANSIMQSFHPEKFEKKDAAKSEAKSARAAEKGQEGGASSAGNGEAAPATAKAK